MNAEKNLTLLDIAQRDGNRKVIEGLHAIGRGAPEVYNIAASTIQGTSYTISICEGVPRVGFRNANEGNSGAKSKYIKKNVECHIISEIITCDKAVAQSSPKGAAAEMTRETKHVLTGAMLSIGMQTYYGTRWEKKGFPGIQQVMGDYMTLSADPAKNIDNKANREDNSGSSVYMIVSGPDFLEYQYGNGKGLDISSVREQILTLDDNTQLDAYVASLLGHVGLQCASPFSVVRIKNITKDNPLTDRLLAQGLNLFPAGIAPSGIYMNRTSRLQLQNSRILAPTTGSGQTYAPTPTEFEGIPIVCTDSILDDETDAAIDAARKSYFERIQRSTLKS